MEIELLLSLLAGLFVLGFFVGFKKFSVPKCIQKIFSAIIGEFAASTEKFTKKDLLRILESNVETADILNDREELKRCIEIFSKAAKRKVEIPEDLNEAKKLLVDLVADVFLSRGIFIADEKGYRVHNVLNMLTEKHYTEARSVTRNDDILYGSYQVRHITSLKAVLIEYSPLFIGFLLGIVAPLLAYLYPGSIFERIIEYLDPRDVDYTIRGLFVFALGILLKDVFDNVIKAYYREMYRVVVGRLSGVRYDLTYDDRLSGNIRRRLVSRSNIDLEQTFRQRVFSRFSSIPVGTIKIRMPKNEAIKRENPGLIDEVIYTAVDCMRDLGIKGSIGKEDAKKIAECVRKKSRKAKKVSAEEILEIFEERPNYIIRRFKNMPYPNEMYKAIKTIQLGHIRRRMKHADKILMRKGGAVASIRPRR